jgi:hypothetical protein
MMADFDIIIIRRGLRSEITGDTLQTAEQGFTTDTNQLFIGTDDAINEIVFDPFANAHATIQSWLDSPQCPQAGLVIDEDLVIRNVTDVNAILLAMQTSASFNVGLYARARRNVEIITENSFNQLFADQHLSSLDQTTGLRSSLYSKILSEESGVFLSYDKNVCTSFFIDYSLKQSNGVITYVRVGNIKVINGVPQGILQGKLTDENTEIWQDDGDSFPQHEEFSNISFDVAYDGDNMQIVYTQLPNFSTQMTYTVKRWSM